MIFWILFCIVSDFHDLMEISATPTRELDFDVFNIIIFQVFGYFFRLFSTLIFVLIFNRFVNGFWLHFGPFWDHFYDFFGIVFLMIFWHRFWTPFFRFLTKNGPKSIHPTAIRSVTFSTFFSTSIMGSIFDAFFIILGWFWDHFGWIFDGLW